MAVQRTIFMISDLKQVKGRQFSVNQVAKGFDLHENVLLKLVRVITEHATHFFPVMDI